MPIITGGTIIEGGPPPRTSGSGAPSDGTSEIQTLTIGGTPTGGTFTLTYEGFTTAPITWTATDATLIAAVDAALEALPTIGTGGITAADGTLTSGIGTITLTFAGNLGKANVPLITSASSLTGTSPTLAVATTTAGVDASGRGMPNGSTYYDTASGVSYVNTGTALAPTWVATDVTGASAEVLALAAAIPTVAVADVAGTAPTISAANAVAVAGTTPAGGTGATEGAYDTAVNRDLFIATVAEVKVTVNALVTEATELKADVNTNAATVAEIKAQLNSLLAKLRTAGIVTP